MPTSALAGIANRKQCAAEAEDLNLDDPREGSLALIYRHLRVERRILGGRICIKKRLFSFIELPHTRRFSPLCVRGRSGVKATAVPIRSVGPAILMSTEKSLHWGFEAFGCKLRRPYASIDECGGFDNSVGRFGCLSHGPAGRRVRSYPF